MEERLAELSGVKLGALLAVQDGSFDEVLPSGGSADRVMYQSVPTERGAYEEFYRAFARSMREDAPPPVDPEDAVRVLDGIESINAAR